MGWLGSDFRRDRLEALQVGSDELGQLDEQRDVQGRQVEDLFPEIGQVVVAEVGDVGGGLAGEDRDVSAGEVVVGGSALCAWRCVSVMQRASGGVSSGMPEALSTITRSAATGSLRMAYRQRAGRRVCSSQTGCRSSGSVMRSAWPAIRR